MSKAEPNVVPLCDVLLVLLIIFMVITPLVQKGIDVKLPETQADASGGQPSGLVVLTVQKNDTILINKDPIELRMLLEELRRIYSTRQDKTIFVRAEAKLPFGKVMEVMDIAKGAGIDVLGLIPEYIEEQTSALRSRESETNETSSGPVGVFPPLCRPAGRPGGRRPSLPRGYLPEVPGLAGRRGGLFPQARGRRPAEGRLP